ncbi:hypothetical protein E2986_11246 [Frieseomelitta varia]|uniref:HTH CENPB-type domain-containing protein n=1 Tax=Frieseomelitta varia TaxID=561572 RepID=A0A833W001_9HYME|nr:hypothetical protein E2986_11246 [Frieseomelitta varia]
MNVMNEIYDLETRIKGTDCTIIMKTIKKELFAWVCKKYAMNSFMDRHLLRKKALELANMRGFNGFKCSDKWLTMFLKEYGFSTNLISQTGPMFANYRDWIDLMRSTINKYRHKDLFHVDEMTMYSDIFPSEISPNGAEDSTELPRKQITILMCCNSSGTTKLPLLICGPYSSKITVKEHVYCQSEDYRIGDELFRNWLSAVNDRMIKCHQKVLLFLRHSRARSLKDFIASNIQLVYFPEDFPPSLRPLRRDIFHYVKMVFRRRYAERLKQYTAKWDLRSILTSLIEAWESIPRELIIFNFQRTRFRTDDCFLQINCDFWNSLKLGISFKRFVTFDDDLSDRPTTYKNIGRCHRYKIPNCKNVIEINDDPFNCKFENINQNIKESMIQKLSNESVRNLETMPTDLKKHTSATVTSYEKSCNNNAKHSRLKGNAIKANSGQGKSQKRTYSDTQFSTNGWNDNRCTSRQRNIVVSKDLNVNPLISTRGKTLRDRISKERKSFQSITDKTLTLSSISITEANCTKKLTDDINMTDHEIMTNPNNLAQFKYLNNKHNDTKFKCMNQETGRSIFDFLNKFNQPSTSTNNWNVLSEKIDQGTSQLEVKDPITNDESSLSSVHRTNLHFTKKKRQKSPESTNVEDDSQISKQRGKKLKTDHNWFKQFETTFVFGSPNRSFSLVQSDENIVDSGIFNISPFISSRD